MKRDPSYWEYVEEAANAVTPPARGVMPAWVKNKSACRWAWANVPAWRKIVDNFALSGQKRREYVRWAGRLLAAELRRREAGEATK